MNLIEQAGRLEWRRTGFHENSIPVYLSSVRIEKPKGKQVSLFFRKKCIVKPGMYPPGFAVYITLEVMDTFSARPENIIGNVALASLLAGVPLGFLISAVAAMGYQDQYAGIELIKNIAIGAVVAPVYVFVCGLVVVAPLLALLRRLGYGGPFFAYAISIGLALPFLSNGVLSGLAVNCMALAASYVFCRFAYSGQLEPLAHL